MNQFIIVWIVRIACGLLLGMCISWLNHNNFAEKQCTPYQYEIVEWRTGEYRCLGQGGQ